jgi:hypothetical protein
MFYGIEWENRVRLWQIARAELLFEKELIL